MNRLRLRFISIVILCLVGLGWNKISSPIGPAIAQIGTSTETAVVEPQSEMFITVICSTEDHLNVRSGPSTAIYPIVGTLPCAATAPALGRSPGGDWIQIEFAGAPENQGWVFSGLVSISPGTLRIVDSPPTPIPPATATIDPTLAAQFTIVATQTRLPTFTPPPSLTSYVFTEETGLNTELPYPPGIIITMLGLLGGLGLLISLVWRR